MNDDFGESAITAVLHCFAPHVRGLYTLCGKKYSRVMYANDPHSFIEYPGGYRDIRTCQDCLTHEDLPLALLGDT